MSHLYGDSTSFPYDVDYIELSRHAVDCAVQLFSAQHAISAALDRAQAVSHAQSTEATRLAAMTTTVADALAVFSTGDAERVATRIMECVQSAANEELVAIERQGVEEVAHTRNIIGRSGESAHRALEAFLMRQDLPGTELSLSWSSLGEQGYTGHIAVRAPFGINAVFSLGIPPEHPWARPRRLAELAPGLEVHFPQQSGWLSKRVEMAPVKLDRLFLSAVQLDAVTAEFRLRKGAGSGAGYRVLVDLHGDHQVVLQPLGEDGLPDAEPPLALDGEDSAQMFRLCSRVVDSIQDLSGLRRGMESVDLDGQPLNELEWPATVAERIILQLAPVITEISRRSGAPGELVLRRDVGGGRREEMYVTKAELFEKLLVLPPMRRAAFDVLGLSEPVQAVVPPASASPPPRSGLVTKTLTGGAGREEPALNPAAG